MNRFVKARILPFIASSFLALSACGDGQESSSELAASTNPASFGDLYTGAGVDFFWSEKVVRSRRAVVVLVDLAESGTSNLKWIYDATEAASGLVDGAMGQLHYGKTLIMTKNKSNLNNLVGALNALTADGGIDAVDLMIHTHGSKTHIDIRRSLADKESATNAEFEAAIKRIPSAQRKKFRVAYSTACYGLASNQTLLNVGFKAASGSRLVSATSALELPRFWTAWGLGQSFGEAVANSQKPLEQKIQEDIARAQNVPDVDSRKVVSGNGRLTKSSKVN